jgi:hypothetical protein
MDVADECQQVTATSLIMTLEGRSYDFMTLEGTKGTTCRMQVLHGLHILALVLTVHIIPPLPPRDV